mmetsp:Transcript_76423/g.137893  ORF Transcript_76423/g.137893 Transcript_76423/m.137893 type:complete len:344 (+) Transcript_76423:1617-2648(+)
MAYNLWVLILHQPLQRLRELTFGIHDEVLDVVVDPPLSVLCQTRAPNEAVQERGQKRICLRAQALQDVRVPIEQVIATVVVVVTVGTDGQQVDEHGIRSRQATTLNGPVKRRNRLSPHCNVEHPHGSLATWRTSDGHPKLLCIVGVDCPHDYSRTLVDGPHKNSCDEAKGPPEAILCIVVRCHRAHHFHSTRHIRCKELGGNTIAYVSKAYARNILHTLSRVSVHFDGHLSHPVCEPVQPGGGLLEEVLPSRGQNEEPLVKLSAEIVLIVLRLAHEEALQRLLLRLGLPNQRLDHALHVGPKPGPGDLVRRVPVLGHHRSERSKHHCLELCQVYRAPILGKAQ